MIRQAQLQLEADDTKPHSTGSSHSARRPGGFVADAAVHPVEGAGPAVGEHPLRIPASELTEVMTAIKGSVEKVVSESQGPRT